MFLPEYQENGRATIYDSQIQNEDAVRFIENSTTFCDQNTDNQ